MSNHTRTLFLAFLNKNSIILIVVVVYILSAILILPVLNTPFNDDWCYARMTQHFLQTGQIEFLNWGEPTLLGQIIWGALFAVLFGWSFSSLHISTVFLSLLGVFAFYKILRLFQVEKYFILLSLLLLIFNPIYFINSFTFMNDVPFLALALVSIYFFSMFQIKRRPRMLVAAAATSIMAYSFRQTAIVLPCVFLVILLVIDLPHDLSRKRLLLWGVVMPFLANIVITFWRYSQPNIYSRPFQLPRLQWSIQLALYILIYVGFFVIPFTTSFVVRLNFWKSLKTKLSPIIWLAIPLPFLGLVASTGKLMPYLGNQISPYGMFRLNEILVGERAVLFPYLFWVAITALAICSVSLILLLVLAEFRPLLFTFRRWNTSGGQLLINRLKSFLSNPSACIYLVSFLFFVFPILIGNAFDRYVILMVPGVIIFLNNRIDTYPVSRWTLVGGIVVFAFFTYVIVSDTLAWHSTAWREAEELVTSGVKPTKIDGGFTWCGWYHPGLVGAEKERVTPGIYTSSYLRRFFPKCDNEYVIAFSPMKEFDVIKKVPYKSSLGMKHGNIFVLHRSN